MPAILERKKSIRNFLGGSLTLNDEPPLTEDELEQLESAYDDIENNNMVSWEEAKKILEELP